MLFNNMFLPREKQFFNLYEDMAEKIIEAVAFLEDLARDYSKLPKISKELDVLESKADDVVHKIIKDLFLDHTRVTEEKGDIRFFVHNMDNIIDCLEKAVNRLSLYQINTLPGAVEEFLPLLKEAAQEIKKGVKCLRNLGKNGEDLTECCIKINDLENEADKVNRKWLQKIMIEPIKNFGDIHRALAVKEIVDLLENAMDQCEDVADLLENFQLKGEA